MSECTRCEMLQNKILAVEHIAKTVLKINPRSEFAKAILMELE